MFTGEASYAVPNCMLKYKLQIIIINTSDCLAPDCLHFAIPVKDVSFFYIYLVLQKTSKAFVNGS